LDGDGRITAEELEKVGLDGLPNFDGLGAEGHHYDVESGESILPSVQTLLDHSQNSSFIMRVSNFTLRIMACC
jgi:hypothetical protein